MTSVSILCLIMCLRCFLISSLLSLLIVVAALGIICFYVEVVATETLNWSEKCIHYTPASRCHKCGVCVNLWYS